MAASYQSRSMRYTHTMGRKFCCHDAGCKPGRELLPGHPLVKAIRKWAGLERLAAPTSDTIQEGRSLTLFLSLAAALLALLLRLDGDFSAGQFIWAEDGPIFINQSMANGVRSLWMPYAGYLHMYPRIVSYVGSFFDLRTHGHVLLLGSLLAFVLLFVVVALQAWRHGVTPLWSAILAFLMTSQPHYGEVFLTITNAQWLLGAALSIYVLTRDERKPTLAECLILVLICLTGPFSILLAPLVLLRMLAHGKNRQHLAVGVLVVGCALVQTTVLLNSNRFGADAPVAHWLVWVKAFRCILAFGASTQFLTGLAVLFWTVLAALVWSSEADRRKTVLLLFACACVNILAVLYSFKANPLVPVALGGGNRYTWGPYCFIMFCAALASAKRPVACAMLFLPIAVICALSFHGVYKLDLQFEAYAEFSKFADVAVPIHPQEPADPRWHIAASPRSRPSAEPSKYSVALDGAEAVGMSAQMVGQTLKLRSTSDDPVLLLRDAIDCKRATAVGIEIQMHRDAEGWSQLFWSASELFTEKDAMRRFYYAGDIRAQFAFPFHAGLKHLRLDPVERAGEVEIKDISVYCLP